MAPALKLCARCSAPLAEAHACASCGFPQPLRGDEDYFSALGVGRRFAQDPAALERRFYQLSRALHPDRFTGDTPEARKISLERMSFVNEAFRRLRDPSLLRDYLLGLYGLGASAQGAGARVGVPAELAEEWFEAQDEPKAAARFREKLASLIAAEQGAIRATEAEADRELALGRDPRPVLEQLAARVHALSYLLSMDRDAARLLG